MSLTGPGSQGHGPQGAGPQGAGPRGCPREELGAFLLGALDPAERADLGYHIASCPVCREELARLAPLPGLLSRAEAAALSLPASGAAPAPPELLDAALAAAAAGRRRERAVTRRWRVSAAAGLAAAAVAVGVVLSGTAGGTAGGGGPAGSVALALSGPGGFGGQVVEAGRAWGTQLTLQVHGVPAGVTCRAVAVGTDGSRETVGWWGPTPEGTARVSLAASLTRDRIALIEVTTADGRPLGAAVAPGRPLGAAAAARLS